MKVQDGVLDGVLN